MATDKIEIKNKMLSSYQLKILELYNIPISNVKKLVPVLIKKACAFIWELSTFFETRIKTKKIHGVLELNQSQWLKLYVKLNTQKRIDIEKNDDKDGKAFCKLMNKVVHDKTMENLRNKIDIKLVSNQKDYIKWTSKPSYMSQNIFDNDSVAIRKNKVTLMLNKPVLDLSKVLSFIMVTLK